MPLSAEEEGSDMILLSTNKKKGQQWQEAIRQQTRCIRIVKEHSSEGDICILNLGM